MESKFDEEIVFCESDINAIIDAFVKSKNRHLVKDFISSLRRVGIDNDYSKFISLIIEGNEIKKHLVENIKKTVKNKNMTSDQIKYCIEGVAASKNLARYKEIKKIIGEKETNDYLEDNNPIDKLIESLDNDYPGISIKDTYNRSDLTVFINEVSNLFRRYKYSMNTNVREFMINHINFVADKIRELTEGYILDCSDDLIISAVCDLMNEKSVEKEDILLDWIYKKTDNTDSFRYCKNTNYYIGFINNVDVEKLKVGNCISLSFISNDSENSNIENESLCFRLFDKTDRNDEINLQIVSPPEFYLSLNHLLSLKSEIKDDNSLQRLTSNEDNENEH